MKSKPRLEKRRIVATAIAIADEKGIAAVTLRGIAARLDVHVTSLYNHVATKEAVIDEMVQSLLAEARLPTAPLTWQEWVRQFALAMRELARKHPGAFEAFHHGPSQGERAAELFELALGTFRAGGFDPVSAYSAVKATIVAVFGLELDDSVRFQARARTTDLDQIPVERYPLVRELARVAPQADTFEFLIEVLIAGLEARRLKYLAAARAD